MRLFSYFCAEGALEVLEAPILFAEVAELVDAHVSGACGVLPCGFESHLRHGPVAQRLEQRTHNPLVGGSNPSGPTCAGYPHLLRARPSFHRTV